ncbi:MAG: molybdopterin-dependent oxidoreductase [Ilumatobacteraceae bacterium]
MGAHAEPRDDERGKPIGRRIVLGLAVVGAAGILGGRAVQDRVARFLAPIENADPTGLVSLLPLGNTFRYYSVTGSVPERNATSYRLDVNGLVGVPSTYTLADLQQMPQTELTRDFQCVTGWRVPEVHWSGVRLSDLLDLARPQPTATAIRFGSFDGTYSESLTLDQARRSDVIVALRMLGQPVTHDHGGPVRMYVAPMYGYKSTKWLSTIELTAAVEPGYWERTGDYDVDGWIGESNGREDDPVD